MATPGLALTPEKCEALSELYLALWRQLDRQSGENKWWDIRPESTTALQDEVHRMFESLSAETSWTLQSDYTKTQELLLSGPLANSTEIAAFREYLRDTGLRLADLGQSVVAAEAEG